MNLTSPKHRSNYFLTNDRSWATISVTSSSNEISGSQPSSLFALGVPAMFRLCWPKKTRSILIIGSFARVGELVNKRPRQAITLPCQPHTQCIGDCVYKCTDTMLFTSRNHKIVRLILLQHHPLCFYKIFRVPQSRSAFKLPIKKQSRLSA